MEIHFGQRIKEKYEESRMSAQEFADAIGKPVRNMYNLFKQNDPPVQTVIECCKVLKYNFFDEALPTGSEQTEKMVEPKHEISVQIKLLNHQQKQKVLSIVLGERAAKEILK
jgi:predicted transcriptional regulator